MKIPDEAVEAAAKALYGKAPRRNGWATASEDYREGYRQYARAALAAAAPHLAARHATTDPACVRYREGGWFRNYLNLRGRGINCSECVPPKGQPT